MARGRWAGFILVTDRDRPLMAVLGVLLLLIPLFQPLIPLANGQPTVATVCSDLYAARSLPSPDRTPSRLPDDCPCCMACHSHCGAWAPLPRAVDLPAPVSMAASLTPALLDLPPRPSWPPRPPGCAPPFIDT